jgi:RHS repeat-associated protein
LQSKGTSYKTPCSFKSPVFTYVRKGRYRIGRRFINPYRYGFNGKEKDDEVEGAGNEYDFGDRIYDPRLGRFFSIDPKFKKFSDLSPYNFAGNSPILMIDKDGGEPDRNQAGTIE